MSSDLVTGGAGRKRRQSRWTKLRQRSEIVSSRPAAPSFAAEQYRNLAVQVQESIPPQRSGGYTLMVTSPEGGSGKTLTSLNLALTIARGGERRVLLLEADLWKPSLDDYLDLPPSTKGLAQALERDTDPDNLILSVWAAGIDVLPAGDWGRADNLADDQRLGQLIDRLRAQYDIVVVDGPPMLLAAGRSLASLVDSAVLVVRTRHSKKKAVEAALSILGPRMTLGLVLNGVSKSGLLPGSYGPYRYYEDGRRRKKRRALGPAKKAERKPVARDRPDREATADSPPARDQLSSSDAERSTRASSRTRLWPVALGVLLVSLATAGYFLIGRSPNGSLDPGAQPEITTTPVPVPEQPPGKAASQTAERTGSLSVGPPAAERSAPLEGEGTPVEPSSAQAPPPRATGQFARVAFPSGLWLREGPGTDFPKVSALPFGNQIELLDEQGEWRQVRSQGLVGWVWAAGIQTNLGSSPLEAAPIEETIPIESPRTPDPTLDKPPTTEDPMEASEGDLSEKTEPADPVDTALATSEASNSEAPSPPAIPQADEAPRPVPSPDQRGPAVVVPPQLLHVAEPTYPPLARRLEITGRVVVEVLVNEAGQVRSLEVVEGPKPDAGLAWAALKAARSATFTPATRDGQPIEMSFSLEFRFQD